MKHFTPKAKQRKRPGSSLTKRQFNNVSSTGNMGKANTVSSTGDERWPEFS
jgi:hypothetical protein